MKLRGNRFGIQPDPSEALSIIGSIAREHGLSVSRPLKYTVSSPGYIRRVRSFSGAKSVLRSIGNGWPKFFPSRCGADMVQVKNNLLAFYEQDGKVIKIFHNEASCQRHLEGMHAFQSCNPSSLTLTRIIYSAMNSVPYTIESFIPDSKQVKPVKLSLADIHDLVAFHFRNIEFMERSFSDDDEVNLKKTVARMPLTDGAKVLVNKVIDNSTHLVPFGQVHGDLSVGNFLELNPGKVIIDWELYGRGYISDDLLTIWLKSDEGTRNRIIDTYGSAQNTRVDTAHTPEIPAPIELQLFISLLNEAAMLDTTTYEYLLSRDGSSSIADKSLKKIETRIIKGLNSLASFIEIR